VALSTATICMSAERFTLDTNILVYSVDSAAGWKHDLAIDIVDRAIERDCHLTLQALSEFYAAATRKGMMPRVEAAAQVEDWLLLFPVLTASVASIRAAVAENVAGSASYRDGLLVATATEGGCVSILSEDMRDGATLAGLTVHNPFDGDRLSRAARKLLDPS
jgi:predicted nucleic acid-binding protein